MDTLEVILARLETLTKTQVVIQSDINFLKTKLEQLTSLHKANLEPELSPPKISLPEISLPELRSAKISLRTVNSLTNGQQELLQRLKTKRFWRLYEQYLKPYPILRYFIISLFRFLHSIYLRTSLCFKKKWRPLITLSTIAARDLITTLNLLPPQKVKTPTPRVFPVSDQNYLIVPHEHYIFPEICITMLEKTTIYGGTNLIFSNEEVICHDLYDFTRDFTSEELHGRTIIQTQKRHIKLCKYDVAPEYLPVAANFVDACAYNYAHWITEVLPRIALFCADVRFKDIPLVINAGLHKNILSSLALVAGESREIIALPIGRALVVETLYNTSCAGYVPFERRNNRLSGHSHGMFSSGALQAMCERICSVLPTNTDFIWPEKIYLRRNSSSRNVVNNAEIEQLLFEYGYAIISPEKLTFSQQVYLFQHAKKIIGATGAALANLVFAASDADIFIMIGKLPETSYWYWQNIACATGKKINYIMGDIVEAHYDRIHADFFIDIDMLQREAGFML